MKNFILSFPSIYKLLQKILVRADIYKKNLTVPENVKVLDIGCGPGTFLDILPESAEYHGFDLSETYIESAKKKYAHRNAFFKCAMVETETIGPELLVHLMWCWPLGCCTTLTMKAPNTLYVLPGSH